MLSRRNLFALSFVLGLVPGLPALAGEAPFTPAAFEAAQKAGKPILVEIHASWCPTCKAQAPILGALENEARFRDLVVLRVDFDDQKAAVRSFRATMQSTLIVFKGSTEVGRSVGDTRPAGIAGLLEKTL